LICFGYFDLLVKKQSSEELDKSQVDFLTKVAFTSRGRLVGNDSALGGFILLHFDLSLV
jgi:hypothetical protein